jgi:RimJ/RimL family protein N-acetyltransferase
MGGSDPDNVSQRVLEALRLVPIPDLEAILVAGASNPNLASLERTVANTSPNIRLEKNGTEIGELMAWADVAISGAGTSCWEMCLLGLPALLIHLAPNQRPVATELDRRGIAVHLGSQQEVSAAKIAAKLEWLLASAEARASMSRRGRDLVDGRGASRAVAAMRNNSLRLRRVQQEDCRLMWEWANDPEVRAASFTEAPIEWDQHVDWFTRKLRDPGCVMLIATDERGTPLGQIRCEDTGDGEAEIHVSIAKESRGHGYACSLIDLAAQSSFAQGRPLKRLHAWIKPDNPASRKAFERAEFVRVNAESVKGCSAVHYIRYRPQSVAFQP